MCLEYLKETSEDFQMIGEDSIDEERVQTICLTIVSKMTNPKMTTYSRVASTRTKLYSTVQFVRNLLHCRYQTAYTSHKISQNRFQLPYHSRHHWSIDCWNQKADFSGETKQPAFLCQKNLCVITLCVCIARHAASRFTVALVHTFASFP